LVDPIVHGVGTHPAHGALDIIELGRPAMAPDRGVDEAVVNAEGEVASAGELLGRVLHVRPAASPHPTTMDEDYSRPWLPIP
jgi:hypothetical protein